MIVLLFYVDCIRYPDIYDIFMWNVDVDLEEADFINASCAEFIDRITSSYIESIVLNNGDRHRTTHTIFYDV